jgi:hypothetical protein
MRFAVGDKVEILPVMFTHFVGRRGVIERLTESKQAITLDKYYVRIDGEAEERMFWDIELKHTADGLFDSTVADDVVKP